MVERFGDWGTGGVWRVHQLVSLVQDVPVVHVCLVVPASEVRTMHPATGMSVESQESK